VSTGLLIIVCALAFVAVMYLARSRARGMERAAMSTGDGSARLHSRPVYHGMYVAMLTIVPALDASFCCGPSSSPSIWRR
jgi:hypothetical protein